MSIQDEFEFIQNIRPTQKYRKNLVVGIGDDAAVISPAENYEQVICIDTMVEGIHFTKSTMSPFDVGYKSVAINLSDIAAMGAIPKYYLVSISIPQSWSQNELYELYEGMNEIANEFRLDLIGGDTVSSKHQLVVTVTVIGEVEKGKAVLRRQAKPGDVVFVTGTLGDSAAGLHLLLHQEKNSITNDDYQFLAFRHQRPSPRVKVGREVSKLERASLNDISDGIASELNEIAEASNVSILIHHHLLPLSDSLQKFQYEFMYDWVLFGGEDFELVGTTSKESFEVLKQACEKEGIQITQIGEVLHSENVGVIINVNGKHEVLQKRGYNHFKKGD